MQCRQNMNNKISKWITWISITLLFLFALFVFFLQPLLGFAFNTSKVYSGLEYYDSKTMHKFEKGEVFLAEFSSYAFADSCEIKDFCYVDNQWRDSIVYGKRPDVYAIELDSKEQFTSIKQAIEEGGEYVGTQLHRDNVQVSFYLMPNNATVPSDRFVFAVGKGKEILWFILVTEVEDSDLQFKSDVLSTIEYWGGIRFVKD